VGAVFGVVAIGDKSGAHCNGGVCDHGTVSGIKTSALVSDIGFIGGGVLLATGAALVLFAPKERASSGTGLRLAPIVALKGGGIAAEGRW
jgi:hypothetical protein